MRPSEIREKRMPAVMDRPRATKVNLIWEPINRQQAGFMASTASRLLFSGAFGAGKTLVLCAKGLKLSLDYPGNFGLIARKVRATLAQTTLKTFMERACPVELIADYNKSERLVTLLNGSQILFGGLDDPLKLGSLELGWAGIDELLTSLGEGQTIDQAIKQATNMTFSSFEDDFKFWLSKL